MLDKQPKKCPHVPVGLCYPCRLQDPEFIKAVESDVAENWL